MKSLLSILVLCAYGSIDAAAPRLMHSLRQPSQLSGTVFYRTLTPGKKWNAEKDERKRSQELLDAQIAQQERARAKERKNYSRMLGFVIGLAGGSVVGVYKFQQYASASE